MKKRYTPWNKGIPMREESKRRLSESGKKARADPSVRKRMSEISKKALSNPLVRIKMSEAHKGQVAWNKGVSPFKETIEKQKATYQRTLLAHPEIREKMSLVQKGKKRSGEAIRKFRLKMKGHKVSEETKRKISEAQKGKVISEETKRKISEATKRGMAKARELGKQIGRKRGFISWNRGKKGVYSQDVLEKWRESHKKTMANPEIIKKVSESLKQTYASHPEILKKMAERQKIRLSNPEAREILRKNILKMYESGKFPKQENTKPERQIKAELLKRGYKEGVDFIHQYRFMNKFVCDFCFPQQKVIVEAHGDFWHCNPKKYPLPIHPHQIKGIGKDKSKEAYITKVDNYTWTYLIFWESDIKKDVAKCVDKIEEVLTRKNKLPPPNLNY